jgi:hypothetical protein
MIQAPERFIKNADAFFTPADSDILSQVKRKRTAGLWIGVEAPPEGGERWEREDNRVEA